MTDTSPAAVDRMAAALHGGGVDCDENIAMLRAITAQFDAANQRVELYRNAWEVALTEYRKLVVDVLTAREEGKAKVTVQECPECKRRIAWHISNLNESAIAGGRDNVKTPYDIKVAQMKKDFPNGI